MTVTIAVRNRILQLCNERDITINGLATICGLPPSSIKNILYGKNPDYVYCVLYYILTGKKATPQDAIYIDEDLKHMVNSWTRMWETNYKAGEPLYMGKNQPPMYYE